MRPRENFVGRATLCGAAAKPNIFRIYYAAGECGAALRSQNVAVAVTGGRSEKACR